jgi:hypothetical protein
MPKTVAKYPKESNFGYASLKNRSNYSFFTI